MVLVEIPNHQIENMVYDAIRRNDIDRFTQFVHTIGTIESYNKYLNHYCQNIHKCDTHSFLKILIETKVDMNQICGSQTVMAYCIGNGDGDASLVNMIILAGALVDKNIVSNGFMVPIMYAMSLDNPEIIKILLKAGADVNIQDNKGNTALLYGYYSNTNHITCLKLLLQAGADPNIKNKNGLTALDEYQKSNPGLRSNVIVKLFQSYMSPKSLAIDSIRLNIDQKVNEMTKIIINDVTYTISRE